MAQSLNQMVDSVLAFIGEGEVPDAILVNIANCIPNGDIQGARDLVEERRAKARATLQKAKESARAAERRKALEAFNETLKGIEVPEALRNVLSDIPEGGKVFVVVNDDGPVFTTQAPKVKGGRKGGRIAADAPSGYLDAEGNRILGPLTAWARSNFSEEELQEMGCYTPQSGKFRSGTALAKALGDNVQEDPNPEGEEVEAEEEAEVSAE